MTKTFINFQREKKRNRSQKGSESQGISNKKCQISISRKHFILKKYWELITELVLDKEDQEESVSPNEHKQDPLL